MLCCGVIALTIGSRSLKSLIRINGCKHHLHNVFFFFEIVACKRFPCRVLYKSFWIKFSRKAYIYSVVFTRGVFQSYVNYKHVLHNVSTSCTMDNGSFPGVKYGRGVLLTTHPWASIVRAVRTQVRKAYARNYVSRSGCSMCSYAF